ncbi:hypothetical protein [Klebsiella pneumoniae]
MFSFSNLVEDFAWQAFWGMGGAYEISEFRQILQTTHVGCYLQPLKMALLDDICRFLNFQRHRVRVGGAIELFKAGYSLEKITEMGNWSDPKMVFRYIRGYLASEKAMVSFMRNHLDDI